MNSTILLIPNSYELLFRINIRIYILNLKKKNETAHNQ